MAAPAPRAFAIFILLVAFANAQDGCVPGDNCKAPDCRCWSDPSLPGGLQPADVPQMILVSFEYAVNKGNVDAYTDLLKDIKTPLGCPATATFFLQDQGTDWTVVKELYDVGHEVALTSQDGIVPTDEAAWLDSYKTLKSKATGALIPEEAIQGTRGPELSAGGDAQLSAMDQLGLNYDSTCASSVYSFKDNLLWPFTWDFVDTPQNAAPQCTIGNTPTQSHKGKWQFMMPSLRLDGAACASLSACAPFITNEAEALKLMQDAFEQHYTGKRSPFILYIDPLWPTVEYQAAATKKFLETVTANKDVFVVTTSQALAWIKAPTQTSQLDGFKPWAC